MNKFIIVHDTYGSEILLKSENIERCYLTDKTTKIDYKINNEIKLITCLETPSKIKELCY